eukprot:s843_g11.t2
MARCRQIFTPSFLCLCLVHSASGAASSRDEGSCLAPAAALQELVELRKYRLPDLPVRADYKIKHGCQRVELKSSCGLSSAVLGFRILRPSSWSHCGNSQAVLRDIAKVSQATLQLERKMKLHYGVQDPSDEVPLCQETPLPRPGNLHSIKSHNYYVGAIREAHPRLSLPAVQSIVASEWYHPGLTAKGVWCVEGCELPLAQRFNAHFPAIQREVQRFWDHPDLEEHLKGVGTHTTRFDRLIAGNGTWVDVRLWRGRAFNKKLCERHFRVVCSLVEASPEIWTNPWSHVLLSVLEPDSWVPFHQGHSNGQLTYHVPVTLPSNSAAELAVVPRGGALPEDDHDRIQSHPEEQIVSWKPGKTLVFDDSFSHAVRYRASLSGADEPKRPRLLLLTRAWHPELSADERSALREFIRKGGEERPEGYEMLPLPATL